MNIILVTRFYPPDTGSGGIAAYANYLALGLRRRGHHVCVISELVRGAKAFEIRNEASVYRIRSAFHSHRWTRLPLLGRQVRLLRDMIYAWRVRQQLYALAQESPPDIVEYADIDAEGLFHPPVSPFVVKLHTPHVVLKPFFTAAQVPYDARRIELLEARMIRKADGLSSPSNALGDQISKLCNLDRERIQYVPNAIDTDFFSPEQPARSDSEPLVLYVGRLEPLKGALVFAKAVSTIARAVPNARFIFLGADRRSASGRSQKAELQAMLQSAGVETRVEFHGHGPPEQFRQFYRRATLFVMPSLFENCPYTLLEAMSCGLPVVASRAGGIPEIVRDGENGLLFPPGHAPSLATAVIDLLNSSRRFEWGKAARAEIIMRFGLETAAMATEQFYARVIQSPVQTS